MYTAYPFQRLKRFIVEVCAWLRNCTRSTKTFAQRNITFSEGTLPTGEKHRFQEYKNEPKCIFTQAHRKANVLMTSLFRHAKVQKKTNLIRHIYNFLV